MQIDNSSIFRDYAEHIEGRLKMLGMHVDLLFPNEDVAMNKVLGNIQARGALYGILLTPVNKEKKSLTLTVSSLLIYLILIKYLQILLKVLYGDAMEHRNMPQDDAIKFIYKDFVNKTKGLLSNRSYQHPEAIQTLLKTLFENRSLTVLQYDHIIKYLTQRRELQVKAEIGEDASSMNFNEDSTFSMVSSSNAPKLPPINQPQTVQIAPAERTSTQNDLQKKILDILNKKAFTEKIAQQMEQKTKLSQSDKDDLKQKMMKDERVQKAMGALLSRRNMHL